VFFTNRHATKLPVKNTGKGGDKKEFGQATNINWGLT